MKYLTIYVIATVVSLFASAATLAAPLKPRVVVLTDISTWETDDHESLIRFLAHADMFEIEGLVISTGYSIKTLTKSPEKDFIQIARGVVDAYEKDLPNLMKAAADAQMTQALANLFAVAEAYPAQGLQQ